MLFLSICFGILFGFASCQESDWHMIIGGWNDESTSLATVELYNWRTGEQCQTNRNLPRDISAHTGVVFEGSPIVCGGISDFVPQDICYSYDQDFGFWFKVSTLLEETQFGGSVIVPHTGGSLFIFGGNSLTQAQELTGADWVTGPLLYNGENEIGQCVVQLNDTTTAFLGGSNDPYGIVTLDWPTMTYTKHQNELFGQRSHSACAVARETNGDVVVAIAGGRNSGGMEVWNTKDGTVTMTTEILPQETANEMQLQNAHMVAVNNGNEILLYGGYEGTVTLTDVWKYSLISKTWTLLGNMLTPRDDHVVLPVDGFSC